MQDKYAIELKNVSKYFGSVAANKNINLSIKKQEILALLGENGSGKTTLMNMISGIYYPDEGQIFINGKEAVIRSPKDAFKYKIGMIHQHFKLVDTFTAAENIILGVKDGGYNEEKVKQNLTNFVNQKGYVIPFKSPINKLSLRQIKKCTKEIKEKYNEDLGLKTYPKSKKSVISRVNTLANRYGFNIDVKKKIYDMSVSEKQTVEIMKVLYRGADILILDEPTAVLTPQEITKLFDVLRKMKENGKSIIIITHKLNEVMEISDRVSILRKGEYIGTVDTKTTTEKELTEMMVGKKIDLKIQRVKTDIDKPLLEIRNLFVKKDDGTQAIDDVSFYIRGGEILGVAGVAGCGQKELCEAIAGLRPLSGLIMHKGESIVGLPAKEIINKGVSMSFIPEDRLGMGLCPSFSITDNILLKTYQDKKGVFVDRQTARQKAQDLIDRLEIVTPSTETPVRRLSGGNVQKVLVGREIEMAPNVIITAYPVRGLDINSSYAIYDILNEEKKKGTGILFIGEDLDVMLALCDKIMVLCHGKNMGIVHANKTTKEELGLMMTGSLNLVEEKKDKVFGLAKDSNLTEEQWEEEKIKAEEMEGNKNE
ncbi:MAG: ABC transporter ATP-binding protein [Clostridia bacterium]|nr:ABC transporter ATP-binding protein [Clostridia bacterium]MBQ9514097.1 ABC transporter ATP-binding protein [Clostridia bacterium]